MSESLNSGAAPKIKPGRGGRRPGAGRPPIGGVSRRVIAEATGYSERTQVRVQKHIEIAEKYPFLQGPEWRRGQVLKMGALLEKLPEAERGAVIRLLSGGGR